MAIFLMSLEVTSMTVRISSLLLVDYAMKNNPSIGLQRFLQDLHVKALCMMLSYYGSFQNWDIIMGFTSLSITLTEFG